MLALCLKKIIMINFHSKKNSEILAVADKAIREFSESFGKFPLRDIVL